jgi:hypothetical protein
MTASGDQGGQGGYGEPPRDQPWQQYPHPPIDPQQTPLNYPDYPPQPPQYGYAPPPYGGMPGYPGQPPYPGPYNPYGPYPSTQTNGLAIASLVTSLAGVVFGIPLAVFCYVGLLIPVIAAVLGGVALSQIRQTGQQGRAMAVAGIVIGVGTAALLMLAAIMFAAVAFHPPTFIH